MENREEGGFWKKVSHKVSRIKKELEKDSVAKNPRKPVDCCNPPVTSSKK